MFVFFLFNLNEHYQNIFLTNPNIIYYKICIVTALINFLNHKLCSIFFVRLQFKLEIDPGSDEFWNKEIIRRQGKEQKLISLFQNSSLPGSISNLNCNLTKKMEHNL